MELTEVEILEAIAELGMEDRAYVFRELWDSFRYELIDTKPMLGPGRN